MKKKFLATLIFLLALVPSAMAEPYLFSCYYSLAGLKDGRSDFTDARFSHIWLDGRTHDTAATEDNMNLSGTFTLGGGSYSFINGSVLSKVTGTSQTFSLKPIYDMTVGRNYVAYVPASGDKYVRLFIDAENGMKNVNASWNFPSASAFNGSGTVSNFKTTDEQLADVVPAVEFINAGEKVTGLKLRIVKSSDISTPVAQTFRTRLYIEEIFSDSYKYSDLISTSSKEFAVNAPPEFEVNFKTSISSSDLKGLTVWLESYKDGKYTAYAWRFMNFPEPEKKLWTNHISIAALTDGKSDYSSAKFSRLVLHPEDTARYAEGKFFTEEGTMTVPDGGYSLLDDSTGKELGTVEGAKTFKLRMDSGTDFMDDMVEYEPVSGDTELAFGGKAETGLNGKTITWSLPDELNMSGNAVVPNFKATAEQLKNAVPYIELTSADGKITSVKYKLVKSDDISTALKPSYNTDFRFYLDRTTSGYYYSKWQTNKSEGEWALPNPQNLSTLKRVRVRVRSYEDATNPAVYQWNFIASTSEAEEKKQEETTPAPSNSSGGGCNAGLGIFALAFPALLKKRGKK